MEVLQLHDYVIKYKPSKINVVTNAFSRKPKVQNIGIAQPARETYQAIVNSYKEDDYFKPII